MIQVLVDVCHERDRHSPDVPVFLLAVSWGAKPAVSVAARRPDLVDGLALLYPGLMPRIRPAWWQRLLLKLGMRLGKQRKPVPIPLDDPQLFTSDPQSQRFIRDDRLALHFGTVGLLSAGLALERELPAAVQRIQCPVLMMLAGQDRIIDNAATQRLFPRFGSADLKCVVYENAAHTLEFEPNRAEIVDDLLDWMRHVPRQRGCDQQEP